MMQGFVDNIIAVTKESVKTFTCESLNNVARLINGVSALLLAVLPGKTNILEGVQGWELRPSFRGPRLPRWMENGVSSFNEFIHELSVDSDTSSHGDYYSGEEDNEEECLPPSPLSHTSRLSRSSSSNRYDRYLVRLIMYFFSWILWTVTLFLRIPVIVFQLAGLRSRGSGPNSSHADQSSATRVPKRSTQVKDDIVQRATDRRRGVIEDLHLAIEIFIESTFDMVHKVAHFLLSPSEICHKISGLFSTHDDGDIDVAVPTATLGDSDPSPTERRTTFHQSLNTDARTCQDVITELGYPYEAIRVVTSDGYVLLLERIPRRDSQKVVYLQHGILDSSMGWVANGVVGSPAFAAYDQGYDVFLGNLRGLVSREHIDKNISSRKYWKYSINEHGTQDIPAMIEKIHEIKTSELKSNCQLNLEDKDCKQPYKFCVVCHSLGGAVMLMYIITRRIAQKPHRLSRMILLSPAGFHEDSTVVFTLVERFALLFGPLIAPVIPGLYIPTRFFRMLLNKLARDFHNYPALGGLVQTLMSYVVGGDSSNWIGVLGLPHYNMYDMPGVSLYVGLHLAQIKRAKRFIMFDYGSEAANIEAYGIPKPLDLGQHFNLIDVPIDLVAGRKDKVIKSSMVRKHYRLMKRAGVEVSYNEFEYAHLDFTFSHREELLSYVMSKLLLVEPPQKLQGSSHQISVRSRKNIRIGWKSEADGGDDDDVEFTDTNKIKPLTAREVEADVGEDDIEFTDTNEIKPLEVEADGGDDEVEFTYTNEIKPLATREVEADGGDNDVEFTDTNKIKPLNDGGEDNIEFTGTNEIKPLEVEVDGGDDEVEFTDTNGIKPFATREVEADGGDNDVEFTDTNKVKPLTTREVKAEGGEDDIEFTDTNEIKSFEVEADGGDDDIEFTVTDEIKPLTTREVADRGDDDVEFTNTNEIQPFCTREVEADGGDDDVEFTDANKVDADGGDDDGEFKDTNEIQPLCTRKVEADGGEDDVEFTDTNEIEPVITLEIVADRGEDDIEFTDTNEIKPLEVEADGGDDEVEFTDTNEIKPLATREVEADRGDNDVEFTDTNKIKHLAAHEVEADGREDNIEFTGTNEIKPLEVEADGGDDEVTDTNEIKPLAICEVEADGGDNDVEFTDTNKIKPLTPREVKADGGEDDIEFTDTNEIKSLEVEADGGDDDMEFTVTDEIKPLTTHEVADGGDDDVEFTNTNEIQPFCTHEVEADGGDDDVEFTDTNEVDADGGDDNVEFTDTNEVQPLCTRKVEADGGEDAVEFTDTNETEPLITLEIVADRGGNDGERTDTNEIQPLTTWEVEADGGEDDVEFTDTNETEPIISLEVVADRGGDDVEFTDK